MDPSADLTVLEAEETLGGTWCAARIFPGLLANHAIGAYEYADRRMDMARVGVGVGLAAHGYLPAAAIHAYLADYAREWGVYERIRFRTRVARVARHGDGRRWAVELASGAALVADKVVLATGLSSTPALPPLDASRFAARAIHTRDLGAHLAQLGGASVGHVTVYGGGKSALDAVALALRAHKTRINWVVRGAGAGPGALVPPVVLGGRLPYDVVATRFAGALHPSIYAARARAWCWAFLHSGQSWVGSWLLWAYHGFSSRKVLSWARYEENENLALLKPSVMDRG